MREVPSSLLERWIAYCRMEPFGDDWLQAATVAAASMNPHIRKSIPARDFIPNYKQSEAMNDDEISTTLNALASAFSS